MKSRHARAPISLVLAAAIAALVGCQSSPPVSNSEVIAPIPFSGGGGGDTQGQPMTLTAQAKLGEQPFGDAQVLVYNAITNEEAQVIAPGGGDVVASGSANMRTDADGRFSLQLASAAPGQAFRVVATKDGKTLATLVTGDGQSLVGPDRQVAGLQANFFLDVSSTMITAMAQTGLSMLKTLTTKAAKDILYKYFDGLKANYPSIANYILNNHASMEQILSGFKPDGTMDAEAQHALSSSLVGIGMVQSWLDLNRATLEEILTVTQAKGNLSPELVKRLGTLQNLRIPGTNLTVSFDERYLTIVRAETKDASGKVLQPGKTVRIDVTKYSEIQTVVASGEFNDIFKAFNSLTGSVSL